MFHRYRLASPENRGPLRVMFIITFMPVGGAETLLVNLVRRMDRERFAPELCCLKKFGPLGEMLSQEIPCFTGLLAGKYDFGVWGRLTRLLRRRRIDAVVTVGTGGDKMFWGRLAAWRAGLPVICSALHSTGLPDRVEWLNRQLSGITDAFIGVAESHGHYLAEHEGCPADKVRVIPNGVDIERFRPRTESSSLRAELEIPIDAPLAGILAALRPEKNHGLFLQAASLVHAQFPSAHFLVIGDGPLRPQLEQMSAELGITNVVHFLGNRFDVPELLSLLDVLVLSSHMEANPVSILEAMACETPVVATRVGSVPQSVHDGATGFLVPPGDARQMAARIEQLLTNHSLAQQLGQAGREYVAARASLEQMVEGYQDLIAEIYRKKCHQIVGSETTAAGFRP